MAQWKIGDRVRHTQIDEWGLGAVFEISASNLLTIFFVSSEGKHTRKFPATSEFLTRVTGEAANHPLLDNLSAEAAKKGKHYSLREAANRFVALFPEGFNDPKYLEKERAYKLEASSLLAETLSEETLSSLLEAEAFEQIATLAKKVVSSTNLIFPQEKMALTEALKVPDQQQAFALHLMNLLYGTDELQQRFEAFASCLKSIKADKWTIATYFLFLGHPDECMFVKPKIIQDAASLCAFDINYSPTPNWDTYRGVTGLANYLRDQLNQHDNSDLHPRDMIDVQSFIWVVFKY